MVPAWLHLLATAMLAAGMVVAIVIALDELRHPRRMWIMDFVWPVCALFGTVLVGAAYFAYGRAGSGGKAPFAVSAGKAAAHCGSGCTIGDIVAEWLAYQVPTLAVAFGWKWLFADKTFAVWILDFILAFGFGIAFQYCSIAPVRHLSPRAGIIAALKADALSLTAWQTGMYGFMAFAKFILFARVIGAPLHAASTEFWFMMQIAMLFGFAASYPVNWWLLRRSIKERM